MDTHLAPPPTSSHATGWVRVVVPGRRTFLVRRTGPGTSVYVPERPALARDALGRPRTALTLVLARAPRPDDTSIAPLVTSGRLGLVVTLAADADDVLALEQHVGTRCRPLFARSARAVLAGTAPYQHVDAAGTGPAFAFGCSLPADAALDVLHAFDGAPSATSVRVTVGGPDAPPLAPAGLETLVGGVLDGLDREAYVALVVPQADGTLAPAPRLTRDVPLDAIRARAVPGALAMMAVQGDAVALPYAMTSAVARPSAAALIAGDGVVAAGALADRRWFLGHDLILPGDDAPAPAALPIVDDPGAATWTDAADGKTRWYAPTFSLVRPNVADDPRGAAFAFVVTPTGMALGPGGATAGLSATIRFTLRTAASAETTAALAAAGNPAARAVPLNNLACALEIPYRATGSTEWRTTRFPLAAVQNGGTLALSCTLLDDWVRLAYAALAYDPPAGAPAARIVVDYAFMAYVHVGPGTVDVVAGRKIAQLDRVDTIGELPRRIDRPVFVAAQNEVHAPLRVMQFPRESLALNLRAFPLEAMMFRPPMLVPRPPIFIIDPAPQPRLGTRSIVREDAVTAAFACRDFGPLYLNDDGAGKLTAFGCRDALRLGETAAKAFDEIVALRDERYRVYRSLQQPGRFLVVPLAYRVGRYAATEGDKAYRPMVVLYGQLTDDPAKDHYCLTATLVADVSPYALALLRPALAAYAPAHVVPEIVLPTDPFVAASIAMTWAVPDGLAAPQTLTIVDAFTVTVSMGAANALLLLKMVAGGGVAGKATFTLADGTAFDAQLALDGDVVGPGDTGPVTAVPTASGATLTNRTKQPVNVFDVAALDPGGAATRVPANLTLAAGASADVAFAGSAARALVDARGAATLPIDELDVFVENIAQHVIFVNQVAFANHNLHALSVRARIAGLDLVETADLAEGASATIAFTLPVTTYLAQQKLQFALVQTSAAGVTTTPWRDWNLAAGAVIGITPDLLSS